MNIRSVFDDLKKKDESALIVYTTAGFPTWPKFLLHLNLISKSGADLIEVGVPFSDPIADGPTIQASSQIGLENGATLKKILQALGKMNIKCPIVLMSYVNPILAYGEERLFQDMVRSGISGIIIPDLPVEQAGEWCRRSQRGGLDLILLVTPTSSDQRIRSICDRSQGFVYCVSLTGITGIRHELAPNVIPWIRRMAQFTKKPLAVGFGISSVDQIRKLKPYADGIIVGSRVIEAIRRKEDLKSLISRMKSATRP